MPTGRSPALCPAAPNQEGPTGRRIAPQRNGGGCRLARARPAVPAPPGGFCCRYGGEDEEGGRDGRIVQVCRHKAPRRAAVSYAYPDIPLHQGDEAASTLDIPRRGPLHLGDHAGNLDTITPTRIGSFWQWLATRGPPSLPNPLPSVVWGGLGSGLTSIAPVLMPVSGLSLPKHCPTSLGGGWAAAFQLAPHLFGFCPTGCDVSGKKNSWGLCVLHSTSSPPPALHVSLFWLIFSLI